jgi:SAM-dependent methyltransferase
MAKDLFSSHSSDYKAFRPVYPQALYDFLLPLCARHHTAWDVGCGNGQVAEVLARHFQQVQATDISAAQIEQAAPNPSIHYRVAPAEASGLAPASIDMITVGQALHWFDHPRFFEEVRRVAAPGCLLAAWGYELLHIQPDVDRLVDHFYRVTTGPYWEPERRHIETRYRLIEFPFVELEAPEFFIKVRWTRPTLIAYLNTWSAVKRYEKTHSKSPLDEFEKDLREIWRNDEAKEVTFPVFMRVFRITLQGNRF